MSEATPASSPPRHRRGPFWLAAGAALAVLVAAYSNHFDNGFYFDDGHVIQNNPYVRSLRNVPRFFADARTFSANANNATYRPLLSATYALDYARAGGLEPRAFHQTQFGLLLLLWLILIPTARHVFDAGERGASNRTLALFAATFFCVHTANTQTVNYLSSRSSLIATLGVVGSFGLFLCWPARRRWLFYLLPMAVASFAKPIAVMFAPIAFAWVWLIEEGGALRDLGTRRGWQAAARALVATAPAFVAAGLLFGVVAALDAGTVNYGERVSRLGYLHTQVFVWLHYARLFVLPVGLTADTDWTLLPHWYDTRFFAGLLFVGLALFAVERCSRHRRGRPVAFGLVWFFLGLVPSSTIVPLHEVYNEHRIFLPYVGLTLAATWGGWNALAGLAGRRLWATAAGLLLIAAHAAGTHARNEVWRTDESLWKDVAEKSPANGRGLMNYGLSLLRRGEYARAMAAFERARRHAPNYPYLLTNIGILKAATGDFAEAEHSFRRALDLDPRFVGGYFYYARELARHGRGPDAIAQLRKALEVNASDVRARAELMRLLAARGDDEAAVELARGTLEIDPTDAAAQAIQAGTLAHLGGETTPDEWIRRGLAALEGERHLEAAEIFRVLVQRDPGSAVAWNDLGWARLRLGFLPEAARGFERATILDPKLATARANLAHARKRLGESPSTP